MAHTPEENLVDKLVKHRELIGMKYYHYKNKKVIYSIVDIVLIEENEKIGIIYSREDMPELKWLRAMDNFFEKFEVGKENVSRFNLVN